MNNTTNITQKLKSLSRNDSAYEELLELFNLNIEGKERNELFNSFDAGFDNFFWFVKNVDNDEFVYYSDSVEKLTGYSIQELEEKKDGIFSLMKEFELLKVKEHFNDLLLPDASDIIEFEYHVTTKTDKRLTLFTTVTLDRDKNGRPKFFRGYCVDISNIKDNSKDVYREVERLTEINAQKDKFISIVSHDLRTPFTSLLGFSEILLNDNDLTEFEKREYLEFIYDASQKQLQMVNYLLDWAKLQSGKMTIERRRVNLRTLVSNCVSVLTGAAIRKGVEIKVDVNKTFYVNVDERLTVQAISNLLSNAIKFTPTGKKIFVTSDIFKKGIIELVVKDEGTGMDEVSQSKLFKIDEKLSLVGTNGEKGSGLGLTLVKEIIDKHGGKIWFYSKLGEGSEFHITLPQSENNILVVEDDAEVRALYVHSIEKAFADYSIIEAENGYEAMSIILEKIPTVIITDHTMPLMNGIQLVEAMKKKYLNVIPVIVISSFFNEDIIKQYNELGVTKLITKPVNLNNLIIDIKETILSQ